MLVTVVWRLNQEGYQTALHLADHVDDRVTIRSACIDTALSLEVDPVRSPINVLLPEEIHFFKLPAALHALHDLAKDAMLTLMVDISSVLKFLRLTPIDSSVGHAPTRDVRQCPINHSVDCNGK